MAATLASWPLRYPGINTYNCVLMSPSPASRQPFSNAVMAMQSNGSRVAHYVAPLRRTSIPATHIVFDTETRLVKRHGIAEQRWTCGIAARLAGLDRDGRVIADHLECWSPKALWGYVTEACSPKRRTVLWAHGLPFDLRVSEALRWLPRLGFELEGIVLERTASWASFKGDAGSLLCCDLLSWLPAPLHSIAADLGTARPPFDYDHADEQELMTRCALDVGITAEAVGTLLDWLKDENCGPFRPTGSGQSHACWRRRFLDHRVLVHDDIEVLAVEREAMWAGRVEAWRWGKVGPDPVFEWDLNLAYCRIAQECSVPVALIGRTNADPVQLGVERENRAIMAEVNVVDAQVPVVPCQLGERIVWPVGSFTTTLWEPELRLLIASGVGFGVKRAWLYRTAPALASMASWLIDLVTDPQRAPPPPLRRLAKHWARTIVGRMALRYRRWEDFGDLPDPDLRLGLLFELDGSGSTDILRIGRRVMTLAALAEADSSVPSITGWIMAEARARLWEVICAAGAEHVLYMDTDSVIVSRAGNARLERAVEDGLLENIVAKAQWRGGYIHGPRNLELERSRRLSGVPVKATQTGELEYDGEVWRSLKASLSRSELDHVAVLPRQFKVQSSDPRRARCEDGTTRPFRLENDATV